MKYPKLPTSITALGGTVTVKVRKPWPDPEAFGCFHRDRREIEIDGTRSLELQWSTLFHEWVHTALDDSGLAHLFSEQQQEALCDAIAAARMRERFG